MRTVLPPASDPGRATSRTMQTLQRLVETARLGTHDDRVAVYQEKQGAFGSQVQGVSRTGLGITI